jgi:hypothetical protein
MSEKTSRSSIDDLRRRFDDHLRSLVDLKTKLSSSPIDDDRRRLIDDIDEAGRRLKYELTTLLSG